MFTVTEAASAYLAQILAEKHSSQGIVIRYLLIGETLTPQLDMIHPGDATFDYGGKTVLALDKPLAERLADNTLDLKVSRDGSHLRLR